MDSNTSRLSAGVDPAAYSRMPHKFEKPYWLYTESAVRVAKLASVIFAALLVAGVGAILYSGLPVFTALTVVSTVLLVVSFLAYRHLRPHVNDVAAKRQAALDYFKTCPDEISNMELCLKWSPGLTHSEVAEVLFNRYDLSKFIVLNGLEALKYIPPHCDILSKLDQFVDDQRALYGNLGSEFFNACILAISVCRPDLPYADLQRRARDRFAQAAASAAPSSSLSAQPVAERDVAAKRQAALDYSQKHPETCQGIIEYCRTHPGLTVAEVAVRVANHEARISRDFMEFCSRNGPEAIVYVTDEISLRKLLGNFLASLELAYISPGYSKYEAAIPYFMRTQLWGEFEPKLNVERNRVKARAKGEFLKALRNPGIYGINFGGALAAYRDPGVRLGVSNEEVLQNIVNAEFDNYDFGEFMVRNGLAALRYLPENIDIEGWLRQFTENEQAEGRNLTEAQLEKLINDIGGVQPNWRPDLAVFLRKFKGSPPASSVSVSSAAAAAAAAASAASSSSLSAQEIAARKEAILERMQDSNDDINWICTTPEGQPRTDIDRSALEQEVKGICEASMAQRK